MIIKEKNIGHPIMACYAVMAKLMAQPVIQID